MTNATFKIRNLAAIAAALLLCGCLIVDNFGPAWKEAKPDTCLSKIAESLYASEFRRDPSGLDISALAHGLTVDNNHYLLLKQDASDKGGRLYRFTVESGIFQRWRLDPTMRNNFLQDYPDAPVRLERDTVTLKNLDAPSLALLTEIANKPEYWEIDDQTLYNVLANPECRFEDRDLKTLDE